MKIVKMLNHVVFCDKIFTLGYDISLNFEKERL